MSPQRSPGNIDSLYSDQPSAHGRIAFLHLFVSPVLGAESPRLSSTATWLDEYDNVSYHNTTRCRRV